MKTIALQQNTTSDIAATEQCSAASGLTRSAGGGRSGGGRASSGGGRGSQANRAAVNQFLRTNAAEVSRARAFRGLSS